MYSGLVIQSKGFCFYSIQAMHFLARGHRPDNGRLYKTDGPLSTRQSSRLIRSVVRAMETARFTMTGCRSGLDSNPRCREKTVRRKSAASIEEICCRNRPTSSRE